MCDDVDAQCSYDYVSNELLMIILWTRYDRKQLKVRMIKSLVGTPIYDFNAGQSLAARI